VQPTDARYQLVNYDPKTGGEKIHIHAGESIRNAFRTLVTDKMRLKYAWVV
jgi:hypothetical protein